MNRRSFLKSVNAAGLALAFPAAASAAADNKTTTAGPNPNAILLKNYRPQSIYKIPVSHIRRAKFPIIDMHSHPYAKTEAEITTWLKTMDAVNVEKTTILTMATGRQFDDIAKKYSSDRFELWCGLDFSTHASPEFPKAAVEELERCRAAGAKGIGEIHDKGQGLRSGKSSAPGLHPDNPRVDALWEKAAALHMPVSLHVADPIWMYQPMDAHNDGLMNAYEWRLDNQPNIVKLGGMVDILERTASRHRGTTFIACHFANLDYDLGHLGEVLDRNPNLSADISARYAETAPIPRFAAAFYEKYSARLVYGTDMGFDPEMYRVTFRILESQDEHFYEIDQFNYHWPLYGLALNDEVLSNVYHNTARKLLKARDS